MSSVRIVSKTDSAQCLRIRRLNKAGGGPVTTAFLMPRGELILDESELTHDVQDAVKAGKAKMFRIEEPAQVPVVISAPEMIAPAQEPKKGKKN